MTLETDVDEVKGQDGEGIPVGKAVQAEEIPNGSCRGRTSRLSSASPVSPRVADEQGDLEAIPHLGKVLRAHFLRWTVAVRLLTTPFHGHGASQLTEMFPV